MLVLPEDSDFGQLISGSGGSEGGGDSLSETLGSQQTDLRSNGARGASDNSNDEQTTSRRPPLLSPIKSTRSSGFHPIIKEQQSNHTGGSGRNQPVGRYTEARQNVRHDDGAEFHRATDNQYHHSRLSNQDSYDPMSTESTPSQTRADVNHGFGNEHDHFDHSHSGARLYSGTRRPMNKTIPNDVVNQMISSYNDQSGESVDMVDDIHTTRSSLANGISSDAGSYSSNPSGTIPSHSSEQIPATQPLSLNAPYGVTPSMNQLGHLLMQHANMNKPEPPSILDSEDMMTSYSRIPNNSSLTDAFLRDYNLVSSQNSNSSQQQQSAQAMSPTMFANLIGSAQQNTDSSVAEQFSQSHQTVPTPASGFQRALAGSLPVSVLLSDLLKLTRPQQSTSSDQQSASSRPQHGILQQLRSLPGPFLALLQGASSSAGSSSNQDSVTPNHDASESSQNYQRISVSPSDINSILTRSMRSSGVLPAFPPPKGTPQNWIPPTLGGDQNYHAAENSNADFIAGNTAGFVRTNQNQGGQLGSSGEGSIYQQYSRQEVQPQQQLPLGQNYADNQQRQPSSNEINYSSQTSDGGSQGASGGVQSQQHQMYQQSQQSNQHGTKTDQVQTEQQPQQTATRESPSIPVSSMSNERSWNQQGSHAGVANGGRQALGLNEINFDNSRRAYQPTNVPAGGSQQIYAGFMNSQLQSHQPSPATRGSSNPMQHHQQVQQQVPFDQVPVYNSRVPSEAPVPLGYNPPQSGGQSSPKNQFDFSSAAVESSPKAIVMNPAQAPGKQQVMLAPGNVGQISRLQQQQQTPSKSLSRRRRSSGQSDDDSSQRPDEVMSSKYQANDDDEDDVDSRPISVVRLDGRPTNSGRVRGYPVGENDMDSNGNNEHRTNRFGFKQQESRYVSLYGSPDEVSTEQQNGAEHRSAGQHSGKSMKSKRKSSHKSNKKGGKNDRNMETASSGLMSRLLGTASTNDGFEEDSDDDEDQANEKRKEEIDDAEFGIVNDDRSNRPSQNGNSRDSKLNADNVESNLGSGSTDNEAYARRHQQRSDIEFYGHPGEETRQLKYGILGSGNYEVVNGGIYPEADESTAAVNSIANYVRKPGGLLGGIPKLMAEHSHEPNSPNTVFMPGGRIGGFLRGASANPDEMIGVIPDGKDVAAPLLELIDANGASQLFDPNILSHLGSSGSSARTTHVTKEPGDPLEIRLRKERGRQRNRNEKEDSRNEVDSKHNETDAEGEEEASPTNKGDRSSAKESRENQRPTKVKKKQQSLIGSSASRGSNQFNSYQILPSKKVTIFSDQDLDSAPGEIFQRTLVVPDEARQSALRVRGI